MGDARYGRNSASIFISTYSSVDCVRSRRSTSSSRSVKFFFCCASFASAAGNTPSAFTSSSTGVFIRERTYNTRFSSSSLRLTPRTKRHDSGDCSALARCVRAKRRLLMVWYLMSVYSKYSCASHPI